MANTMFYKAVEKNVSSITWKDIFSEFRKKHTRQDIEYALLAGTSVNTADERSMLNKWRKPWLFYRLLIISLIIAAILILPIKMYGGIFNFNGILVLTICPMLIPLVMMVFFWELNIPRNISIFEMGVFVLVGAFISFLATGVMYRFVPYKDTASWAALREEPAKLAGTVVILYYLSKKKNIKLYGLTGLAVGAAVGTGFSIFESMEYGLNYGYDTIILRMICAVVGHTVFCVPYSAALALNVKDGKMSKKAVINTDFIISFLIVTICHAVWNSSSVHNMFYRIAGEDENLTVGLMIVVVGAVLWSVTLWILKKCLKQIVDIGKASFVPTLRLVANSGVIFGMVYPIGQEVKIGRLPDNDIRYPAETPAVSRHHAKLYWQNGCLMLVDCNSSSGTYLKRLGRLTPEMPVEVYTGDTIYIGSVKNSFVISS